VQQAPFRDLRRDIIIDPTTGQHLGQRLVQAGTLVTSTAVS
jgi:hypothetical protein